MTKFGSIVLSAAIFALPASSMAQYKGGDIKDGGSISGTVKFKGTAPAPKKLEVTRDPQVCGKDAKRDPSLIVSGGNLVNAVVHITDIKTGKKLEPQKAVMDQVKCEYTPHVLAVPLGSSVDFLNSDATMHNVHTKTPPFSDKDTIFNRPTMSGKPDKKTKYTHKFDKAGPVAVKCDVHAWMSGWIFVADNPYFIVTDEKGSFKLADVPPGTYNLEVWHETLGKTSQKVTVKAKEDAKVSFDIAGK